MSFVFISHASDDKKRIATYLQRLQREHGLALWVDRPEELKLGADFAAHGRILLGELWPHEIHRALDDCGCVLVFWSRHTTKDREVLQDEAIAGLHQGKLVQVLLDAEAHKLIDPIFAKAQGEALHKCSGDPNATTDALGRIAAAVQRKFDLRPRRIEAQIPQNIPRHLRPYAIDRGTQINDVREAVPQLLKLTSTGTGEAPSAPHPAIILRGRADACPERLIERLECVEGPDICRRLGKAECQTWDEEIPIGWPGKGAVPERIKRDVRSALASYSGFLGRPRCAVSKVRNLRNDEGRYVRAWIDAWSEAIAAKPGLAILPVLVVVIPEPSLLSWGKPKGYQGIIDAIKEHSNRSGHRILEPILLDELPPVSSADAHPWAKLCFGSHDVRTAVNSFIRVTFPKQATELALDDFARRVEESSWFQALKA